MRTYIYILFLIWAAVVTDEVQSFYVMNISKIKSAEITRRKKSSRLACKWPVQKNMSCRAAWQQKFILIFLGIIHPVPTCVIHTLEAILYKRIRLLGPSDICIKFSVDPLSSCWNRHIFVKKFYIKICFKMSYVNRFLTSLKRDGPVLVPVPSYFLAAVCFSLFSFNLSLCVVLMMVHSHDFFARHLLPPLFVTISIHQMTWNIYI